MAHSQEEGQEKGERPSEGEALFQRMLKTRTIILSGEINKTLAERTIRQLLVLEAEGKDPIKIFIDTPGGDVDAGYAIIDMIRFIQPRIYTIGMGLVASAGALILLGAPKERRFGLPNSHYLIHQPLSGMRGVATEIEIHARELEKVRARINRFISEETGKPIEQIEKDTDRDFWMDAEEAKNYNLIQRIIQNRTDLPE